MYLNIRRYLILRTNGIVMIMRKDSSASALWLYNLPQAPLFVLPFNSIIYFKVHKSIYKFHLSYNSQANRQQPNRTDGIRI